MNNKNPKQVIKAIVRECLTEIFAEMKLESIVEKVVRKNKNSQPSLSLHESLEVEEPVPRVIRNPRKRAQDLGIDEQEWRSIYSDIPESNNPVYDSNSDTEPELVPEETLQAMGVMKDYSHLINPVITESKKDGEDLEIERRKILSTIKRPE